MSAEKYLDRVNELITAIKETQKTNIEKAGDAFPAPFKLEGGFISSEAGTR